MPPYSLTNFPHIFRTHPIQKGSPMGFKYPIIQLVCTVCLEGDCRHDKQHQTHHTAQYLLENGFKYPVTLSSLGQICIAVVTFVAVKGGLLNVSDEAAEYVFKEGGWKGYVKCNAITFLFFLSLFSANILCDGRLSRFYSIYRHFDVPVL